MCSPGFTSIPVAVQHCSPVIWISWEMRRLVEGSASGLWVAAVDLSCRTSWATSRVGQAASVEQIEPSRRSTKSLVIESLRHQRKLAALQKRCLQRMHVLLEQERKGRLVVSQFGKLRHYRAARFLDSPQQRLVC